jgi:hypothetical protein
MLDMSNVDDAPAALRCARATCYLGGHQKGALQNRIHIRRPTALRGRTDGEEDQVGRWPLKWSALGSQDSGQRSCAVDELVFDDA